MLTIAIYFATGILAGLLAGLLGIGGGIVMVPALYFQFRIAGYAPDLLMQLAVGSSLAVIICTSVNATLNHHRRGAVDWALVQTMFPGVTLGSLIGAFALKGIPTTSLKLGLGYFELAVALQLWQGSGLPPAQPQREGRRHLPVGIVIGSISTVLGIGGGTLSVPYLLWNGVPMRSAVATSAGLGIPIAVVGTVVLSMAATTATPGAASPPWTTGFLHWPAILGAAAGSLLATPQGVHLAHRLSVPLLRRVFAGVLALIGLKMLSG